jgi:hypothetical protein
MITGENDYQNWAGSVIGKLMSLPVDTGKFKIRGWRTGCEDRARLLSAKHPEKM